MSLILHIDTAVQSASVCLSEHDKSLGLKTNPFQKDHAAWLHPAIQQLMQEQNKLLDAVDAVSISYGPGSYTGLRVGMSAAKGICYALKKPLITINTLALMASSALGEETVLLCPMIDARRMEVFTAVYDHDLKEVQAPHNLILDKHSFYNLLDKNKILFFGNGSLKFSVLTTHSNAGFATIDTNASNMIPLALSKFAHNEFADLAYVVPFYGKDFHSPVQQSL